MLEQKHFRHEFARAASGMPVERDYGQALRFLLVEAAQVTVRTDPEWPLLRPRLELGRNRSTWLLTSILIFKVHEFVRLSVCRNAKN